MGLFVILHFVNGFIYGAGIMGCFIIAKSVVKHFKKKGNVK